MQIETKREDGSRNCSREAVQAESRRSEQLQLSRREETEA